MSPAVISNQVGKIAVANPTSEEIVIKETEILGVGWGLKEEDVLPWEKRSTKYEAIIYFFF